MFQVCLQVVLKIFKFQISETDILPKTICNYCRERVQGICSFIRKVCNNQQTLLKGLKLKPSKINLPKISSGHEPIIETIDVTIESADPTKIVPNLSIENFSLLELKQTELLDIDCKVNLVNTPIRLPVALTTRSVNVGFQHGLQKIKSRREIDDFTVWELSNQCDDPQWNKCIEIWTDFYGTECNMCNNVCFNRFEQFMQHILKKHQAKLRCIECHLLIKAVPSQLKYHIKYHHDPDIYRCKICNSQEFDPKSLEQHQRRIHGVKDLVCTICDTAFLKEAFLERHNKEKHSVLTELNYKCSICNIDFTSQHALDCHMSARHNIYKSTDKKICDLCGKVYYTVKGFKSHFKTHLSIETPKLKCLVCEEEFRSKSTLKAHIRRRHSQAEPEICNICQKKCKSKAALTRHIRYVHQPTNCYKCELCGKGYRKKYELIAHNSLHTGLAQFQCNYCTRNFYSHSNKFKHMKNMHFEEFERDRRYNKKIK